MSVRKRSWTDGVREAFFLKFPVPIFGKLPLNLIGFTGMCITSLFEPSMWWATFAAESTYLVSMSGSNMVRKVLDEKDAAERKALWEAKKIQMLNKLSAQGRVRFRQIEALGRNIAIIYENASRDGMFIDMANLNTANELIWYALRLLTSKEAMIQNIKGNTKEMLETKIKNMEQNLARESSEKLKKTLESTIATMKKRLETFETVNENMKSVDLELLRIEEQLALLHSTITINSQTGSAAMSQRIDIAESSITESNEWVTMNQDLFGSLGDEFTGAPPENIFTNPTTTT